MPAAMGATLAIRNVLTHHLRARVSLCLEPCSFPGGREGTAFWKVPQRS